MWRILVALSLLVAFGLYAVASSQPTVHPASAGFQDALSACGEDAPTGLILHQAFAADGSLADPPLALLNPATNASRPVDVPDPSEWFSSQYGCSAFVKTATGAYYLVFGRTGEVFPLEFMDPADEWEYEESANWDTVGERRYAYFTTGGYRGDQALVMDLAQGVYWDLAPLISAEGSVSGARFSPLGNYLTIDAGPMAGAERTWLIPTDDPGKGRLISRPMFSTVYGFDAAEERLLYRTLAQDGTQQLILEEIATDKSYLVATDPGETAEYDPFLMGWFIPGQDDLIAVLHHDRFTLVDVSGAEPVERFVIEGHRPFSTFAVAPSGTAGVLDRKPATLFVGLETGESRVITSEDGTAINVVEPYGQWGIAVVGDVDGPARGYGVIDLETGDFRTIYLLGEGETSESRATVWSSDGRVGLFTLVDANQQRHLNLINNERGTSQPIADAGSLGVTLSPNGDWAAYSATNQTDAGPVHDMAVVETATGTVTSVGSGLAPVWLGP